MLLPVLKGLAGLAGVLGVVTGTLLLVTPRGLLRSSPYLWHWLCEADIIDFLNTRRAIEKPVYRHHRSVGVALIAGAILWMWLLSHLDADEHLLFFAQRWLGQPGSYALVLAGWGLALLALIIGLFLLVRPSAMKAVETIANRWIEPFPHRAPASPNSLARFVLRTPRFAGLLLLAAGVACFVTAAGMSGT